MRVGVLVLFLILNKKTFNFPLLILAVGFLYMTFIMLRYFPSIPNLLRFYPKRICIFQMLLCIYWNDHRFYLSFCYNGVSHLFFFPIIFISWRLITLQYCSGFCHTLTWISHGFTCVPHPEPPSHLPPHPIPLGHPSAPDPSTCLMNPTWTGNLFHAR